MSRLISVVSGKGGVGKTITSINLACAINEKGHDVFLVDGDLTNPDIHIHFGAKDLENSIHNVMREEIHFSDAVYKSSSGLKVMPSMLSVNDLKSFDPSKFKGVLTDLKDFSDVTIIDCGAGFSDEVIASLEHCDEVIVVTDCEESSVDSAKKAILIAQDLGKTIAGVVLTKVGSHKHELSEKEISNVLDYPILAKIPYDLKVKKASRKKNPVFYSHPRSKASKYYNKLADSLLFSEKKE